MTEQQPKETTSVTNTLDDLLSNPFSSMDELTPTQQNELSELKEQQAAPRLIDKLPQERQAQAKELASKLMSKIHKQYYLWFKCPNQTRRIFASDVKPRSSTRHWSCW